MLRDFPIRMKFLFFTARPAFALSSLDRLALCGNSRRLFLPLAGVVFHPSGVSGAIFKWSGELDRASDQCNRIWERNSCGLLDD